MTEKNQNWIWGFHSVEACIENYPELVAEVMIEEDSKGGDDSSFLQMVRGAGVKLTRVKNLPKMFGEKRTQGVVAKISGFPEKSFSDVEDEFMDSESVGQWALLDGIQDPRNFGAILRSAAAFDLKGVIYGVRNQTPPSGLVAQASAGNLFRVPLISCASFAPIWRLLPEAPVRVLALDAGGLPIQQVLPSARENTSVLWVLGSEGDGIRAGVREKCHAVAMIPTREDVESLNASVAASLAFYIAHRKLSGDPS